MFRRLIVVIFLADILAAPAQAQTAEDAAAIQRTALDYIEGWYAQDAARMERALHPDLVKRRMGVDPESGANYLDHMGALRLVQATRPAPGEKAPPTEGRRRDVAILDVFGNAATVKVDADRWVDYLHLIRWNGEWRIVNVLWELRPEE
jgi:hypothetical protein